MSLFQANPRREPELHRSTRFCRPLPNCSAIAPILRGSTLLTTTLSVSTGSNHQIIKIQSLDLLNSLNSSIFPWDNVNFFALLHRFIWLSLFSAIILLSKTSEYKILVGRLYWVDRKSTR